MSWAVQMLISRRPLIRPEPQVNFASLGKNLYSFRAWLIFMCMHPNGRNSDGHCTCRLMSGSMPILFRWKRNLVMLILRVASIRILFLPYWLMGPPLRFISRQSIWRQARFWLKCAAMQGNGHLSARWSWMILISALITTGIHRLVRRLTKLRALLSLSVICRVTTLT